MHRLHLDGLSLAAVAEQLVARADEGESFFERFGQTYLMATPGQTVEVVLARYAEDEIARAGMPDRSDRMVWPAIGGGYRQIAERLVTKSREVDAACFGNFHKAGMVANRGQTTAVLVARFHEDAAAIDAWLQSPSGIQYVEARVSRSTAVAEPA